MEVLVHQKKCLVLTLLKQTQNFVWVSIIMLIIVICLLTEMKFSKFKADNKNINFPTQIFLGSIFNGFSATKSREISLNENVYDFSVDYNSIDKSDTLSIHKYLIIKSNMK